MLVRVIERDDGGVAVIVPMRARRRGERWRTYYAEVFGKALDHSPDLIGRPYADIEQRELPTDRTQRDHWRLRDGRVVISKE